MTDETAIDYYRRLNKARRESHEVTVDCYYGRHVYCSDSPACACGCECHQ